MRAVSSFLAARLGVRLATKAARRAIVLACLSTLGTWAGCATSAYERAGSSEDVADGLRVDVVRTIGHLSGAAATTALVEYIASVPAKDDRPSKKEA